MPHKWILERRGFLAQQKRHKSGNHLLRTPVCHSRSKAVTQNRTVFEMLLSKFINTILDTHAKVASLNHLVPFY